MCEVIWALDRHGNGCADGLDLYERQPTGGIERRRIPYDALDRMYGLSASGTTLRCGSEGEPIGEQSSTGTWLRRYANGQAADEPLVWHEGAGAGDRRWFHADERGSVIAGSDGVGNAGCSRTGRAKNHHKSLGKHAALSQTADEQA